MDAQLPGVSDSCVDGCIDPGRIQGTGFGDGIGHEHTTAQAQVLLGEYLENPKNEKFASFTPKQIGALKKLSQIKDEDSFGEGFQMMRGDPMGIGKPGCAMWHYDFEHRPLPRDILKAKCFMADLVEDYFFTVSGDPRPPYSQYISIS